MSTPTIGGATIFYAWGELHYLVRGYLSICLKKPQGEYGVNTP